MSSKSQETDQSDLNQEKIAQLESQLITAQESEKRALADYQNLVRRSSQERVEWAKLATLEFVEALIEPLRNLNLASQNLNDQGLNMVVAQFWQKLEEQGLQEITAEQIKDQPFDVETMEAVEKKGDGDTVLEVLTPGYKLNDKVISHARVIVG